MRFTISLFLSVFSYALFSQDTTPDLVTDRPDQTESSVVVPLKSLQLETGFVMINDADELLTTKDFAYNTTLLRYGLFESTELRLGFEYLGSEVKISAIDSTIRSNGFGPLIPGFKTYIVEEKGWRPEIAVLGALVLPFSAHTDFKPAHTSAAMRFAFSHTLSERFSLGYNLGAQWNGEQADVGYYYSLALGVGILPKLGAFAEVFGLMPEGDRQAEHAFDAGLTYLLTDNFQLDISGGIGLNEDTFDNFISFGFSWRLDEK